MQQLSLPQIPFEYKWDKVERVVYKHEIAQLSRLISRLLCSAGRLLYCNEEVQGPSLWLSLLLSEAFFFFFSAQQEQQLPGLVIDARRGRDIWERVS